MHIGIDLVEVERIQAAYHRWGDRFLNRVYTPKELTACAGRSPSLASRFAAKEAAAKALGVGIGYVHWRDIEVVTADSGQPQLVLHGQAQALAEALGVRQICISLSDTEAHAIAVVILS